MLYDNNFCFNSFYPFLWTKYEYESYNQIMNHKFSLNFPWDFQIFWLFKFSKFLPNYPGFPRVLWTLLSRPLSQLVVQSQD